MDFELEKINISQQEYFWGIEQGHSKRYFGAYVKYLERLAGRDGLTLYDVGGGGGHFANEVKNYFDKRNTDVSVNVIDYARYDNWSLLENIRFVEESALTALEKLPDNSADVIFFNLMLHHLVADTYRKSREAQRKILEITRKKIKSGGYVFIYETSTQNPLLGDLSTPVVYFMTSAKLPLLTKAARKLGSQSAGVGVCFLSQEKWLKTLKDTGFELLDSSGEPYFWKKKLLIRQKFFWFVLTKNAENWLT
ncbi:MAG: class I SAM-dependent methyltransferase [Oscillospiraceae bacterium]|nr:class I SAM-dependent methyltransferase [Oscillospiraceae bacterium]